MTLPSAEIRSHAPNETSVPFAGSRYAAICALRQKPQPDISASEPPEAATLARNTRRPDPEGRERRR